MMKDTAWIVSIDNPERVSSYRYNAIIPANELSGQVLRFGPDDAPDKFLAEHDVKEIVLCKPIDAIDGQSNGGSFVRLAEEAKSKGVKVFFHMSDWHFENVNYRQLSKICDRVVVQTKCLAEKVIEIFGVTPAIIEEPFEGPRDKAKFKPGNSMKLLWFGHSGNLDTLEIGLQQLQRVTIPYQLAIVTNDIKAADKVFLAAPKTRSLRNCEIIPFDLVAQQKQVKRCDVVLIPSHWGNDKIVKGHNRLVQSIHGGRIAVAFPFPQYKELGKFCICCEDMGAGVHWAAENRRAAFQRIKSGQVYIDQGFSPGSVAAKWKETINDIG